jgi:hypothetical protein
MVHELAHHHHRSEKDLGPIIQDLMTQLDTHPSFNFQDFKQKVIYRSSVSRRNAVGTWTLRRWLCGASWSPLPNWRRPSQRWKQF